MTNSRWVKINKAVGVVTGEFELISLNICVRIIIYVNLGFSRAFQEDYYYLVFFGFQRWTSKIVGSFLEFCRGHKVIGQKLWNQ